MRSTVLHRPSGRRARSVGAALAAGALLVLSACSSQGGAAAQSSSTAAAGSGSGCGDSKGTIAVVSHGKQGDSFWDIIKKGAQDAGAAQCYTVTYQGSGDPNEQSQAIDNAVAQKVKGLVVSMANPGGVETAVKAAVAAGVPVITINSGLQESAAYGALTHVGQTEKTAGEGAGTELKKAGVTKLLCVIHEAGNAGLEDRCAGAAETLGGTTTNLQVDVSNLSEAQNTITSALQADPSIDGVLTLNNGVAISASGAIDSAGSKAKLATFDLDSKVTQAIKDGKILFAVDQQPYLQGYLPVVFLSLYNSNANVVGGGQPVLTGPSYVTKDNVDKVTEYAARGTR